MRNKTLLIIGGTGFFGRSILDFLSRNSLYDKKIKKVIVLSRSVKKLKLSKTIRKKIKLYKYQEDISVIKKLPYADYVLYCVTMNNPLQDHKAVNNYLKLARIYHKESKILYTSSGAVYGSQPKKIISFKENYLHKNKKNYFRHGYKKNYSKYKLLNEKNFQELARSNFKISIARCFSFVGKFLLKNKDFVIGHIISKVLKNKLIKINANYKILRSYMYSDDLAQWLLKILFKSNYVCKIWNVGSDNVIDIQKVMGLLSLKYDVPYECKKIHYKKIDKYIPNVDSAKKKLDLDLKFNSFEAICKTIEILRNEQKKG